MTHPAFPSLPPAPSQPLTTPAQIRALIEQCSNLPAIAEVLIPCLNDVVAGRGQASKSPKERLARGEEAMAMGDVNLMNVGGDELRAKTTGFLYICAARLGKAKRGDATANHELFAFSANLCLRADPEQVRLCPAIAARFAHGLLKLAKIVKKVNDAVYPLEQLLFNSAQRARFWGVSAVLLETYLITRQLANAAPLIDDLFTDFITFSPTYLDIISFYHHAGLICAAAGDYGRAKELFVVAVSAPTQTASAIQLACAKRAILCGVLDDGKFPKYTSGNVTRVIERNSKEYQTLAKAFESAHWDRVKAAAASQEFALDANAGLVEEILESIPRRRILHLRGIYTRLPVERVAKLLGIEGEDSEERVTTILGDMISTGSLRATLSSDEPATVTFAEEDVDYTAPEMLTQLAKANETTQALERELSESGRYLGLHMKYLTTQASMVDSGSKVSGKSRPTEFDAMMAAEEGPAMKGVGGNYADMGF